MAEKIIGNTTYEGNFEIQDKVLVCVCGNSEFKLKAHMDMNDRAVSFYQCTKCGNTINATYKREMPW